MPTTIYDSSLITQRSRDKVIAQRIKQDTNAGKPIIVPQAGYGSYQLGEADNGNITYFRRIDGCTDINLSCNCTGSTTVTTNGSAPAPAPSGGYTLTYNRGDGGSGASVITNYSGGSAVTISGQGSFSATGRTFGGWNTAFNGTGTFYDANDTLTMPYANTILYAQWYNPSGTNYQVIYNGNGSTGGSAPATENYKQYQGVSSIANNTGSLVNGSLTFYGWNTSPNGSGTAYPVTSNGFTMPAANVTLYAQWVNTSNTFTLTYDGMGNTGGSVPAATSYPSGAGASVAGTVVEKSGYNFLGWNTAPNGTGSIYQPGSSIVMNANATLYAQWVGGTLFRGCGADGFGNVPGTSPPQYIWGAQRITNVYRDNTNSTITGIIQYLYNRSNTGPYGTGDGPSDTPPTPNPLGLPSHSGNIKSSLAKVVLSQVGGTYEINITYTAVYTGTGTDIPYTTTANLPLTSAYWPVGQTFNTITTSLSPISYTFGTGDTQGSQTENIISGCQGAGGTSCVQPPTPPACISRVLIITTFYINFSNGTSTRVALTSTTRWNSSAAIMPLTYAYNYTRVELASGPTSNIPFTTTPPTNTTAINTPNV